MTSLLGLLTLTFTLILIITTIIHPSSGEDDPATMKKLAIGHFFFEKFLDFYQSGISPSTEETQEGKKVYEELRAKDFKGRGTSSVHTYISLDILKRIIKVWSENGLISTSDQTRLHDLTQPSNIPIKSIVGTLNLVSGQDLYFGLIGIISMTKEAQSPNVSVAYSFYKMKLGKKYDGVTITPSSPANCILWSAYCPNSLEFHQNTVENKDKDKISEAQAKALEMYLRVSAIRQFGLDNGGHLSHYKVQGTKYETSLPEDLKAVKAKFNENPGKKPQEIFTEGNPMPGDKYDF